MKMSKIKLKLIAAASKNMGIGVNGQIPWRLKNEMGYFTKMTSLTSDPAKKNVVIMGRITWDCIPLKYRPLANRINLVLTSNPDDLKTKVPEGVLVYGDLESALKHIETDDRVENVWVIGGSAIYKMAMEHPLCHRIYLTEIEKDIECDTFFPPVSENFKLLTDHGDESELVPTAKQIEGDYEYHFRIYEKIN